VLLKKTVARKSDDRGNGCRKVRSAKLKIMSNIKFEDVLQKMKELEKSAGYPYNLKIVTDGDGKGFFLLGGEWMPGSDFGTPAQAFDFLANR
jgi:formate-dependent phosphoribosylglycinamide formyltransferase (GAR transformylase)